MKNKGNENERKEKQNKEFTKDRLHLYKRLPF